MANDSLEVKKDEVPFHPCLTPRGMTWYDLDVLTAVQQKLLNEYKTDTIRENNQYLAKHPEIRAIIVLFLRAILREKPRLRAISEFAKDFFSGRPLSFLQSDIDDYLKERGEPKKKEGDSAVNLAIYSRKPRSSMGDATAIYHKDYYTWTSYTDEQSIGEELPEWSNEDLEHLYRDFPSTTGTYTSSTAVSGSDTTERREFELLFASRASPYTGESLEASTIDLTKEYMEIFGGAELACKHSRSSHEENDEETLSAAGPQILEEIQIAEQIEAKLSVIIENLEDEEEEIKDEDVGVGHVYNKRSIIEMDLESLKEKQSHSLSEDIYEDEYNKNSSVILESMLNYEIETED